MHAGDGQTQEPFSAFQMPRKELSDLDITRYRVYRTSNEYVMIVADSAAEAMQKAGINQPFKVQREFPLYKTLLMPDWIGVGSASEAAPEKRTQAAPEAATMPKQEVSAPAKPATVLPDVSGEADAPLSQEEINKLLEG